VSTVSQRSSAGQEQLEALVSRGVVGKKAKRDCKPVRGDCRGLMSGGVSGVAQRRDSRRVALSPSALNVMCALYWSDAAICKRCRTTLVCAESPPARRGYVHRSTNKRMTKAKAAGYVSLTNHVEAK
jgi:hypothetical protein